jgi:hypothetical protein
METKNTKLKTYCIPHPPPTPLSGGASVAAVTGPATWAPDWGGMKVEEQAEQGED